jgi:hypothetical protein
MAYELHIERPNGEIALAEWKLAIAGIDGVKPYSGDGTIRNPKTGELIQLANTEAGAEFYAPGDRELLSFFIWHHGRISFKPKLAAGEISDHLWQAATTLASRLHAVIRGDQGELYDFKTGKALPVADILEKPRIAGGEEIKFIFKHDTAIKLIASQLERILKKFLTPNAIFKLNGQSIRSEALLEALRKIHRKSFDLEGEGFIISYGSIANPGLDFLTIKGLPLSQQSFDAWLEAFISDDNFTMAWVMDSVYDYWQNAHDPLQYTAVGKPYSHLPMKSNGLPYPLEKKIIDISNNPGRWTFHRGYVEAVAATMWLGDHFFQLTGTDKSFVENANWLKISKPFPSVLKIQAAKTCFDSVEGISGELQKKLRALLYGKSSEK